MTMKLSKLRPKKWLWPPRRDERGRTRSLVFSPLAWLKLQFLCHAGPTEVGGFGLSHADDLLYVEGSDKYSELVIKIERNNQGERGQAIQPFSPGIPIKKTQYILMMSA